MSATVRTYHGLFVDGSANDDQAGSLDVPIKEFALTGDTIRIVGEEIVVAIGEEIVLWEYSANRPYFDHIRLQIMGGSGYLELGWKSDAATSASDPTPLGTAVSWDFQDLSCTDVFVMTSDDLKVHGTIGTSHGDTGGEPTRWDGAVTMLAGRIYKLMARNPSTATAAVRLNKSVLY